MKAGQFLLRKVCARSALKDDNAEEFDGTEELTKEDVKEISRRHEEGLHAIPAYEKGFAFGPRLAKHSKSSSRRTTAKPTRFSPRLSFRA